MNAKEIKEIRKNLNLSQEEFAKLIGVSKNTIYNYENGSKIPDSKITILQNLKDKKANIASEPNPVYTNGRDNKIAEYRTEIEKIKKEIHFWEQKIIENPKKIKTYEIYITGYENQIKTLLEMIEVALEAKRDSIDNNY